ncbi:MAG TPA: ACT domain-containing protein [Alcanivoracaceae bacterium]|nr:ACT domain-containing protein [Alcanivoracaceae bacterium]
MPGLNTTYAIHALQQCTSSQAIAQWWQQQHQALLQSDASPATLLVRHCQLLDALLSFSLQPYLEQATLIALGHYGRQQLLPYAPASILLLGHFTEQQQQTLQQQLHALEPRLQCRIFSLSEWQQLTQQDVDLYTEMLAARFVAGSRQHWAQVQEKLPHWPTKKLFTALEKNYFTEQLFSTAPNLRTMTGGLRHIAALQWLSKNAAANALPIQPVAPEQQQQLTAHRAFLLQTSWWLQCHTGSNALALTPSTLRQVAKTHNKHCAPTALTAPMLLQKLYTQSLFTAQVCRIQLQRYREILLTENTPAPIRLVNRRFLLRHKYLDVTSPEVIERWPFSMVEMFVIQGEEPNVERLGSGILEQCVAHKAKLSAPAPAQQYWFLRLLARSHDLFSQLLLMHQLGLLEQLIPAMATVKGASINEPEQRYPRDLHGLVTVRELQRLRQQETRLSMTLAYSVSYHLPKPELLYIAGLFHKLMPLSSRSIAAAQQFCERHELQEWETALILWLVEHYSLMLTVAEQQDTADPSTVYAFARAVGNLLRLDYLYLLTIAAIRATNPSLWNGWRGQRLEALYHSCKRALRRGVHNPMAKADWATETRAQATQLILDQPISTLAAQRLWTQIGDEYFLREKPTDIIWHTKAILQHGSSIEPLVLIREQLNNGQQKGTQLFVYTRDMLNLFAVTVNVLERLGFTVIDANIITSAHGFSLDTYVLLKQNGQALSSTEQQLIQQRLSAALSQPEHFSQYLEPSPLLEQHIITVPTQVQLANSADGFYTVVAIQTQDQPGVLANIARIFAQFKFSIHHARISTYGDRVEDTFHISDADGLPLSEASQCFALQSALLSAFSQS